MNSLDKIEGNPSIDKFVETSFDISDRIHEILQKRGISQKELAEMLGRKESQVSKWMTGTHNFTIKTVTLLQTVLNAPILNVSKAEVLPNQESKHTKKSSSANLSLVEH